MNAALYAVSLASEPAMAVNTWLRPFGATRSMPVSRMETQSWEGKFPRAGRFMSAEIICSEEAALWRWGLLYPTGMEAICAYLSFDQHSSLSLTTREINIHIQ